MSKQIQIRRGSATEHENFTGAIGEITMDTTNKTLRIHDGETAGGIILAKQSELESADYVIESQMLTEENGYTWYKKYKSGWIEQGGFIKESDTDNNTAFFPIEFSNTNYTVVITAANPGSVDYVSRQIFAKETNSFNAFNYSGGYTAWSWIACGI